MTYFNRVGGNLVDLNFSNMKAISAIQIDRTMKNNQIKKNNDVPIFDMLDSVVIFSLF
jgi:hypothetical protein